MREAQMIEASDLSKRFGDLTAVECAAFSVPRGELFGFLGPNGAGKTTTINMLTGLDSIMTLLPGVVAISILFGTTSMLAVTVTFEKKNR